MSYEILKIVTPNQNDMKYIPYMLFLFVTVVVSNFAPYFNIPRMFNRSMQ